MSHGTFAAGLKNAVEVVMGQQEELYTVGLALDMNIEEFKAEFRKMIDTFDKDDEILLFCDIFGGCACADSFPVFCNFENDRGMVCLSNIGMCCYNGRSSFLCILHKNGRSFLEEKMIFPVKCRIFFSPVLLKFLQIRSYKVQKFLVLRR